MNYSGRSSSTVILLIRMWNETYSSPKGANPSIHWNTYLQVLLMLINPVTKNIQCVLIRKSYLCREKRIFCTIGMIFLYQRYFAFLVRTVSTVVFNLKCLYTIPFDRNASLQQYSAVNYITGKASPHQNILCLCSAQTRTRIGCLRKSPEVVLIPCR